MDNFEKTNTRFPHKIRNDIKSKISSFDDRKSKTHGAFPNQSNANKELSGNSRERVGNQDQKKAVHSTFSQRPAKVQSIKAVKESTSKKMSDWGDEDNTEVTGKGFGNNNVYKSNDHYQSGVGDNENASDNYKRKGYNGGARNSGSRGRGNAFHSDNRTNGVGNVHANSTYEHYKNPIFALTPKDFSQETLLYFVNNMPELFRNATLLQKYTLMKYLMHAYERSLKKFGGITQEQKQKVQKKASTKTEEKDVEKLQITFDQRAFSPPTMRNQKTEQERFFDLRIETKSSQSDTIDLFEIFQQDSNNNNEEQNTLTLQDVNQVEFEQNILLSPIPQIPAMNISDLFEKNNLSSSDNLELPFLRQQQPQQQEEREGRLLGASAENLRQSERLRGLTSTVSSHANQIQTNLIVTNENSLYNLRSTTKRKIAYQLETPPTTPKRLKPHIFISEEEYRLRFRLPRKIFLEISQLPCVRYNNETSSISYFGMDMTLIEKEYLSETDNSHQPTENSSGEVQLQTSNTLLPLKTLSSLATTRENLSSLNVRQAVSSIIESSSFGRPLLPATTIDVSRIVEESTHGILKDVSSHVEAVGIQNNGVNCSIDSISSVGAATEAGHNLPQSQEIERQIPGVISLTEIKPPPQITTDSGVHFPTPNLLTTGSALQIPSSCNTQLDFQTSIKRRMRPVETPSSAGDPGIFKTPMVLSHKDLQPMTTLPSVEEHLFESTLKTRILDVSTPVTVFAAAERKTMLARRTTEASHVGDGRGNDGYQTIPQNDATEEPNLQPIFEARETSNERPSTDANSSEINVQNKILQVPEVGINLAMQTKVDDYRKDWYEILRARLHNMDYKHTTTTRPRPKHPRPPRRLPQTALREQMEGGVATSHLLQQTLAGILPSVRSNSEKQNLDATASPTVSNAADISVCEIPPKQQQYDEFILDNVESITTIMDNLSSCRVMLDNYRRGLQAKLSAGAYQQPCERFDPEVLLNAPKQRLSIKLALLQNIIRQVSFDFTKCDCVKDRMSAATSFAFLLEMKSAGFINLTCDGRTVSLHFERDRRRGEFAGRGRGTFGRDGGQGDFKENRGDRKDRYEKSSRRNEGEDDEPKKQREFYIPPEPTENEEEIFGSGISSGINFSKYDNIPIKLTGENIPSAIQSFEEANLRDIVVNNVKRSGYKVPTPIQKTAIPVIKAGRDLMACAQTGSGKTAAFLLPIINSLLCEGADVVGRRPQALIISPTRELAIQIFNEARKFAMGSYLIIRLIYGGTSAKHQCENIGRGGIHILICTPGRLLDFVEKDMISFEDIRFVVLDEADRMLDMGFKNSMTAIMNHHTMRPVEQRQNIMFSATFPAEIQRMAGEYLNDYIFISIGVVGGACSDVKQNIYEVKKSQKRSKLMEILGENADRTIVFVETKRGADFLASLLSETDFPTTSIHGDRLQSQREMALSDFKSGKMKVLIATSVAARGLDIKNVNHVINFDMPSSIDEYVHRIGRTGRVGNNGRATSFFDPNTDSAIAADLVNILKGAGQEVPNFLQIYSAGGGNRSQYGNRQFGGRDVRRGVPQADDNFINTSGPSALEDEEEWN